MGRIFIPGYQNNLNIEKQKSTQTPENDLKGKSFSDILREKEGIKFSSHAIKRMNFRNIDMNSAEMQKLQDGVEKLRQKGGKDSVVVLNEKAYVVSVKNNTVVTVINESSLKENVFTNIDSMVIM